MTDHQTTDNRHHLAIWCRAEVFTFGALTTPPPPEITPLVIKINRNRIHSWILFSFQSLKSIVKSMKKSGTAGYPKMK